MSADAKWSVRLDLSPRSMRRLQRALIRAASAPNAEPRAHHALAERVLREFLCARASAPRGNAQFTSELTGDEQALIVDALNQNAAAFESGHESDDIRRLREALERAFHAARAPAPA